MARILAVKAAAAPDAALGVDLGGAVEALSEDGAVAPSRRPWPAARVDGAVHTRHLGCHDEPRGPGTASREVRLRAQPPHVGIAPSRARGDFGVLLPLLLMARLALITLPVSGEGRLLRSVERVGGAAPAVD